MLELATIQQALALDNFDIQRAHQAMAPSTRVIRRPESKPGEAKLSAVMLLLFPEDNHWHITLIKRVEYPGVHSGQISFPGGRHENGETFLQTALRETYEEVGIPPEEIQIIGQLTPIYIPPSDFMVHPFVGYLSTKPLWSPDHNEVQYVIELPLPILLDDSVKGEEEWTLRDFTMDVHFYHYQDAKIWGATAIMLSEFEGRLKAVLNGSGQ